MALQKKPGSGEFISFDKIWHDLDAFSWLNGTRLTNGDDSFTGTDRRDSVQGRRGDDLILGGKGNDRLWGDRGNDGLAGGEGNDLLNGGKGRDFLVGGAGRDTLIGGDGDDKFVIRKGTGTDIIEDLQRHDYIDLRSFGFKSAQDVLKAFKDVGRDAVLDLGNGDKLIIDDLHKNQLHADQFIVSSAEVGPSTTTTPYLLAKDSNVSLVSLLTTGDSVGVKDDGVTPWRMAGIPDGLGAFDNSDGTFTVLMNHELGNTLGVIRDHGLAGAFVSKLVIDKSTLQVIDGSDLIQHSFNYNATTHAYEANAAAYNRFCSADLADVSAWYNADTGLGYNGRIFTNGEESGVEGRALAHFVTGSAAGNSYELAWLGNMAFENVIANAHTGDKTVVGVTDDGQNGQVYFYSGTKTATGAAVDKAGLTNGHLFGLRVAEFDNATNNNNELTAANPLGADETSAVNFIDLGDVSGLTGAQIDTLSESKGVTSFLRPEDGAWDTVDHNRFYFVTTDAFNAPSRLWAVDFVDAKDFSKGGSIKLLLNGTEGQQMLDNITVNKDGHLILQEDVGNNAHLGRVFEYDPVADKLTTLAEHDPARFLAGGANFLTQDEESSGVIDVTDILGSAGQNAYLLTTQAHNTLGGELVEGGQLQLMYQDLI